MAKSKHGTLAAGVVTTVTVDTDYGGIEVVNRDQAGEMFVRLDGTDPVVDADDTFVVLGSRKFENVNQPTATVKLISSTAVRYSVEGKTR